MDGRELVESGKEGANVVGESPRGSSWELFSEKSEKWVNGNDEHRARGGAALDDSSEDFVEKLGAVTEVGVAAVFVVEGSEKVKETSGDLDRLKDYENEGVCDRRERGAKVEENEKRGKADVMIGVSGGDEVGKAGTSVESDRVVDALSAAHKAILLVIRPVADFGGNFAIDHGSYGFVVRN